MHHAVFFVRFNEAQQTGVQPYVSYELFQDISLQLILSTNKYHHENHQIVNSSVQFMIEDIKYLQFSSANESRVKSLFQYRSCTNTGIKVPNRLTEYSKMISIIYCISEIVLWTFTDFHPFLFMAWENHEGTLTHYTITDTVQSHLNENISEILKSLAKWKVLVLIL